MLDIGWSELLVIAVVMIVVVGPKDLPKMLRAFGKATAKLRATASEFRTHFDEALREAELDEVKKTIDGVKQYDPRKTVTDIFEPVRSAGDDLRASLNNSTPKPDTTPAVPMDSPLDLADVKEEEAKAKAPAKPAAVAETAAAQPVKKTTKPRAKKPVADAAEAPVVKKPAAPKAAAKSTSATKPAEVTKAAPKKAAAAPKAATPRAKTSAKTTKKTGTEQ